MPWKDDMQDGKGILLAEHILMLVEKSVWILFLVFVYVTQFSDFLVMGYGNWKHILGVFSFHNSVFNGIFVVKLTILSLFSRNIWLLGFFEFFSSFETKPCRISWLFSFFFWNKSNGRTEWWVPNRWGWGNWDILSDEWQKLSEEWWVMTKKIQIAP